MRGVGKPIVYISYRWLDVIDQGRQVRGPDPRAETLAEKLRASGVEVRFDLYFRDNKHGFRAPERVPIDPRDPWLIWSTRQIAEVDAVLMFCTPEYAKADPDGGRRGGEWWRWSQLDEASRVATNVPALWWDWLAIARECDKSPQKFIPVGEGHYDKDLVPAFVRGAHYVDLLKEGEFDGLLRRIRLVRRERAPRSGVFFSYAHKGDQKLLDDLLSSLSWLKRDHGVELWTDQEIEPGARWHEEIQAALERAKVAVLLVSGKFLDSPYITNNELPQMLEAAETDGMTIFWIPLRPSAYKRSPIAKFQAAHNPEKPLSGLSPAAREQAFVVIGEKLANVLGVSVP